jgi:xanthine phosphoribosyltransferase|tara:strand:- start:298 stop:762 length:465 start_codon:yes stop_codon:yes gene_type:complete
VIKKHYYSWQDIENMCSSIVLQMYNNNWRPDYIVGITRGGNIPATIISNMLDIPCEAMKVSFRNDDRVDKDFWLSELVQEKNILIVDDINDTGETFKWILKDWMLEKILHKVKFATLTENIASDFGYVSYYVHEVNKSEEDVWLVYPWENVGVY